MSTSFKEVEMEQNMSEHERHVRLGFGILLLAVAIFIVIPPFSAYAPFVSALFLMGSAGFFLNYYTGFSGEKKLVYMAREKLEN